MRANAVDQLFVSLAVGEGEKSRAIREGFHKT
jgi:hypothetical protein